MLCMVLVICNSVSILADTPAAETTTAEKQVKETKSTEDESEFKEDKAAGDEEEESKQSEETGKEDSDQEEAPEVKTTEKKEETTEATTEKKEDESDKADEATTEAADKATTASEATDEDDTDAAKEEDKKSSKDSDKKDTEEAEDENKDDAEKAEAPTELTYEDDDVKVTVSAVVENAIPEGATLKVKPVINSGETAEQYEQVKKKLEEQKTEENTTVAGFLAYDISLFTEEGNEIEPNGEVKVDIDYKEASIADIKQGIVEADSNTDPNKELDVTVLHLEENQDGSVKDVVDLSKQNKIETLETTEEQKVQKISFNTSSFSIYCVTWNDFDGEYEVEVGENITLRSTNDASSPKWSSSDSKIASVKSNGNMAIITGIKSGEVKITYKYYKNYKPYTETCTVYVRNSSGSDNPGGSGSVTTEKELSHEKYILYNSEDDTYDLTLNVSGAVGTETQKAPMDILFIMDTSNSMKWSMSDPGTSQDTFLDDYRTNSNSRFYNQQKAVRNAVKAIEDKGTIDARYAVVSFDTLAGIEQSWTESSNIDFPSKVANYSEDNGWGGQQAGGTNYEAALEEAEELLDSSRAEADKVIVFLSDGDVTFYNDYDFIFGKFVNGDGNEYSSEGMRQAKEVLGRLNVNYFYTVGVGPRDSYTHLSELRNGAPHGATVGYFEGETADDLSSAFDDIIAEVTDLLCTDVTITDTLSDYVEPVDKNADLKVVVRDENGDPVLTPFGIDAKYVQKNGKTQIVVTFPEDYQLQSGYTYFVTAKIKATDFAYQQYEQNGGKYGNMRGDEYTDENTNPNTPGYTSNSGTSSKQPGFYANDDAIVEYVYNGEKHTEHYKKPVIQISEDKLQKLEPVNFYLNLSSTILDASGNLDSSHGTELFTTSVSGSKTAESSDIGIGVPLNDDLRLKVPKGHNCTVGDVVKVIEGQSTSTAKEVDQLIRKLSDEEGVKGNVPGHEDEKYQIVNEEGPYFPSTGEIFEYIRDNWTTKEEQAQGQKGVNKGNDITVNGHPINKENLTEKYFAIRWYVLKEEATDKWHIDGVLVPKSGILNVTKTFPNTEVVDAIKEEGDFRIDVTGDFLTGTEENPDTTTTISLRLPDESTEDSPDIEVGEVTNEDGSVTYTWTLAIFGEEYTVAESGYDISGEWIYNSTDCTYTDVSGETTTLENLTTGNGTISATINTVCDWQDTDTQEEQTLNFINYYSTDNEDNNPYILVKKTFKGLSFEQIEKLYKDFTLTVTNTADSSDSKELHLNDENVTVSPESTDKGKIQDYTFTWKVEDCTTGTYTVTEKGQTVGRYGVTTEGTGKEVEVSEETWTFDPNVETITANNETSFVMGAGKIVLATLKANGGYLIWTNEQLSITQREAIVKAINDLEELKTFKNGKATISNCHFYYGNALIDGITIGGSTVKYTPSSSGTSGILSFGSKSSWQHIGQGSYTMTNAQNADIAVTNTYTAQLDLKKVSTANGNPEINGAKFKLTKWNGSAWESVTTDLDNFEVSNTGTAELSGLIPGTIYKLEEIEAPEAHMLLGEPIYFTVEDGTVKLCDENGVTNPDAGTDEMWSLDQKGTVAILTIKNNILYDLPSAGGPGIYWYTLSGTLLMAGAALIVYRQKRKREVLLRK